jgi:PAS domain S-box-containing protein
MRSGFVVDLLARYAFRLKGPRAYLAALVIAVVFIALRLSVPHQVSAFPLFFPAAALATVLGGLGPGLLTMAVCGLAGWYVLLPEPYSFNISEPRVAVSLLLYLVGAAAMCWLISLLRQLLVRLEARDAALRRRSHETETLSQVARTIASDLNLESIVQSVTDAATALSGASFGAFFHNAVDGRGEHYALSALSGAPRAAFESLGLPRKTALFAPTFDGTGIVRSDDVRRDPRYGGNHPHVGMPPGHLPVVSYLAVPVVSRSGQVHGGLFLGHELPGVFTADAETAVAAIAAHAAVAIDNARLLEAAKREVTQRRQAEKAAQHLAAIVESSDDAIIAKDLDGIITSWNAGAERLFGYTAEEIVGRPVTVLIPPDRQQEEPEILARIRRGERTNHFETIRQRKDGSLVDISLTVSPIKDPEGNIIGASKIARDATERRRAEEQQTLLLREMNHRFRNLMTLASSVVTLSARSAASPEELAEKVRRRLDALARAHALTLRQAGGPSPAPDRATSLHTLIRTIVSPYVDDAEGGVRVVVTGCDVPISAEVVAGFALLLHELATNAAKYGALSAARGVVSVDCSAGRDRLEIVWVERGGPAIEAPPDYEGFGSVLSRATVEGQLGGRIRREWAPDGLTIRLTIATPPP